MPQFDILRANVSYNNDTMMRQFDWPDALTWPELNLIEYKLGQASVQDVAVVGEVEMDRQVLHAKLVERYGAVVGHLYPGARPPLEERAPMHIPREIAADGSETRERRTRRKPEAEPENPDRFADAQL